MNEETQPSPTPSPALDGKTFAIGVLSVTACILFVGLLLITLLPTPAAHAAGQVDRGGDYIMLTQQIGNNYEAIVVIDAAAKKMNLYGLDKAAGSQRTLRLIQRNVSLDRLPGGVPGGAERRNP